MGEINVLHANKDITQHIEIMSEDQKETRLCEILKKVIEEKTIETHAKAIIFTARKVT